MLYPAELREPRRDIAYPPLSARADSAGIHMTLPPIELRARRENLGPAVNSRLTELGPVIAPDGRTLFFTRGGSG